MEKHKPTIIMGFDIGRDDMNTIVVHRTHRNGQIEILSVHQWNKEIDLNKNEYKINPR